MTDRDHQRLIGVHPILLAAIIRVLDEMDAEKAAMFVVEGVRSDVRQAQLYAQGRTTPGQIVTYKNGTTNKSNHQPKADGLGYAVDCAFVGPQPFDPRLPWEKYGEALESYGIGWGGRFSMKDLPHAELVLKESKP